MTVAQSNIIGPVTNSALAEAQSALSALRASKCYGQYKANGTLSSTKLGECEQHLLTVIGLLS